MIASAGPTKGGDWWRAPLAPMITYALRWSNAHYLVRKRYALAEARHLLIRQAQQGAADGADGVRIRTPLPGRVGAGPRLIYANGCAWEVELQLTATSCPP